MRSRVPKRIPRTFQNTQMHSRCYSLTSLVRRAARLPQLLEVVAALYRQGAMQQASTWLRLRPEGKYPASWVARIVEIRAIFASS